MESIFSDHKNVVSVYWQYCFSAHLISCYFRWEFVVSLCITPLLFSISHFMLFQMRFRETSCGVIITLSANQISPNCKLQNIVVSPNVIVVPPKSDHNNLVSLSFNSHEISFSIMWLASQPIRTLQILKYPEKIWDFRKFFFHLKSKAVTQLC